MFSAIHAKYSKICTPIKSLEHESGQGLSIITWRDRRKISSSVSGFGFSPTFVPMLSHVPLQRGSFSLLLYLEGFSPVHHGPSQQLLVTFYEWKEGKSANNEFWLYARINKEWSQTNQENLLFSVSEQGKSQSQVKARVWARFGGYLGCFFGLFNTRELQNLPDLKAQHSGDPGSVAKSPLVSLLIRQQGCHASLAMIHLLNSLWC